MHEGLVEQAEIVFVLGLAAEIVVSDVFAVGEGLAEEGGGEG